MSVEENHYISQQGLGL